MIIHTFHPAPTNHVQPSMVTADCNAIMMAATLLHQTELNSITDLLTYPSHEAGDIMHWCYAVHSKYYDLKSLLCWITICISFQSGASAVYN